MAKFLDLTGLTYLLSKLTNKIQATVKEEADGVYLPITGGEVTGNLTVDGTTALKGATTAAAITASGAVKGTSTLNITGASTLAAVTASGAVTAQSTLAVTGATTLSSTLKVTGTTTAAAVSATDVSASGTLAVTGKTTASDDVTVGSAGLVLQASDGHIVLPSGVELY